MQITQNVQFMHNRSAIPKYDVALRTRGGWNKITFSRRIFQNLFSLTKFFCISHECESRDRIQNRKAFV